MNILKNILKILAKITAGIFVFYLFCAWVVIPFGVPWIVKNQGTKILKHPTLLRKVQFNPFLLRLTLKELQITDTNKHKLVGFDHLSIDVSFLSLFKKIYRVESVQMEGLLVQASLSEEGGIDLLELIPSQDIASTSSSEEDVEPKENPPALPLILVDKIMLKNGRIQFEDKTVTPHFITALRNIDIEILGLSTNPNGITTVNLKSNIDDKGIIDLQAQLKPLKTPVEAELNFALDQYALTILGPYTGKYTGNDLKSGKLDFKASYKISDEQLNASHKLLIQKFEFGKKVKSEEALNLPFGLAIALLEDSQERINISLPVKGDMSNPEFEYTHLIWQVVRNFFTKLVTKPFSIIGSLVSSESGTDELGHVRFAPGESQLSKEEKNKILSLVQGLKDRPKLILEINGSYDPTADWKAIKADVFKKDHAVLRAESTKNENWVLETLYQRRFGIRELWKLSNSFQAKDGSYDHAGKNAEIKRRLIEEAPADRIALDILAESRAKVVYDQIINAGLDNKRVRIGNTHEVTSSMGYVPLEFTLTVFSQDKEELVP